MKKENTPTLRFDPLRRAGSETLQSAVIALATYLETEEQRLRLRRRARRPADQRSFRAALDAIACNLLVAAMVSKDAAVSVPRGHDAIWGKGRYSNPVFGKQFILILDLLERLGLIRTITRGFRVSASRRQETRVRPTKRLSQHLPCGETVWGDFDFEQRMETIVLRPPKSADDYDAIDYKETRNTRRWRCEMHDINQWLHDAPLSILQTGPTASIDEHGQPIDPCRRSLRRVFNNGDWRQGGRLFGGFWQSMKREDRFELLRIADEPVANVDYEQLFPRLAYARALREQPIGDLYDVTGDSSSRDGWKQLINALLFTTRPLKQWPSETRQHFTDTSLKSALDAILRKHGPIAKLFNKGLGFNLMRIESDMLVSVLIALFKAGVPALPLHDSVLVPLSKADAAKSSMQAEFTLRTGSSRGIVKVQLPPIL